MASKKTLNAKNLEALGAARLAELLLELSAGDAAAKRRLRLELAGSESAGEVAREVRKRLTSIARARSFIDWQKGVQNRRFFARITQEGTASFSPWAASSSPTGACPTSGCQDFDNDRGTVEQPVKADKYALKL